MIPASSETPLQSILVVDDDTEIVRLVRAYLEQAGYAVISATDGTTALKLMHQTQPALVVLDLMLPDIDGHEITRIARSDPQLSTIPVIMLTARIGDSAKIHGLEIGADDYITKPFNPREVVARVRSVLRRTMAEYPAKTLLEYEGLIMDLPQHRLLSRGQSVDLTPTEFNLLRVMMKNPGYAFTRSELIEQVLGYDHEGLERTLDSHIKNLRRKIEVDSSEPVYIQTVYGVGYRFSGSEL